MKRNRILLILLCLYLTVPAVTRAQTPDFSASLVAGCSPLVVNFTDKSSGTPTAWNWDFGNGATSTLQNPSTTYFTTGKYAVTLSVTYAGETKSVVRTDYITVYENPSVRFTVSNSAGCAPFAVQFTEQATPGLGTTITQWMWDFGDGTQSTAKHPYKIFSDAGNYTLSLRVGTDKGCWSVVTKNNYIKVNEGVKADFDFTTPITCLPPFPVHFTNRSTGAGTLSYQWRFGDGATSVQTNPIHLYASSGNPSIQLIAKSSAGCTDTLQKAAQLAVLNTATSFSAPDSVCVNRPIQFTNTSSTIPSATIWNFGDGTSSLEANPVKQFSTPGTFRIQLVQKFGVCSDSVQKSITVFPKPVADFTATNTVQCQIPLVVDFKNNSKDAVTYEWDFGDGTTSTAVNPTHTFTNYGTFKVRLKATNAFGCTDVYEFPGPITIAKPEAKLEAFPPKGCLPLGVQFTSTVTSADPVTTYVWDFGDGGTSTLSNPSHTFTKQGSYTVSLTITTASGCTEKITVSNAVQAGTKPAVNFSALPNPVCAYQPVTFTNLTPEGTKWLWAFGDGMTSTEENPVHEYSDTGSLSVLLVAENYGCRDSLLRKNYITVKPPISRFTSQSDCDNKTRFLFKDQSIGATSWQWNFGDGTTSTEQHPVHTYLANGTYTVSLTVSNDTCFHTSNNEIRVVNGSTDFTASVRTACKGAEIIFTASNKANGGIVTYNWNWGNGSAPGSGYTTSVIYPATGKYTISLTATDVNGCTETITKPQYIQVNGPSAGLAADNTSGCKGLNVQFTDRSKDDGISPVVLWNWNLGDGTLLSKTAPASIYHNYNAGGSFPVSLKVRDAAGCTDSILLASLVNVSEITAAFSSADSISCPGADIEFTNQSSAGSNYTSIWSFGNGLQSATQHPITRYTNDGAYTVKLTITDSIGCSDSVIKVNYVQINHPVASFTVNDSASACIPFQVQYTNTSSYYTQHLWDLGGGTTQLNNPTQFYNQPGVYLTKLVVTSPGGCTDTATKKITVFDIGSTRLKYLPLNGCKPLKVELTAEHPVKMNMIWDMGDGSIFNSTDSAQQHVYTSFGNFVPKLILSDGSGCVVAVTGLDTIRIKGATAKFGLDNAFFCDSGMVRFTDSTTFNNSISAYTWNFGDGTTSAAASPSHYYSKPGIYPVSLYVKTQNNCVDTFRLSYPVKVVASPLVGIAGDSVICIGEGITHFGKLHRSDTSQLNWAWRFPNGKTAFIQKPPRQYYTEPGKFAVQTIASNGSGCRDTVWQNIYVNPVPRVTLPTTLTTVVGTPVLIPARYSDSMKSYQWSVAEGLSCVTCPQPYASPKLNTVYNVEFVDEKGCRNTGQVQVIVLCNNDNVFVPNTFSPNGDGSNDVFYIRGKGLSRVKTLRIFNRWGQVVFEKANFNVNDASMGWNGIFKGAKPVPEVYVYQVEIFCDNSQVVKFEGNVALIQ